LVGEYLDIAGTSKSDYTKRLRLRRLICRVCNLKLKNISDVSIEEDKPKVLAHNGYLRLFLDAVRKSSSFKLFDGLIFGAVVGVGALRVAKNGI
jgi:hypothetical protein